MSKLFMLDANTASYVIKGIAPAIDARLRRLDVRQVCISAITRAELRFGVRRLAGADRLAAQVDTFLNGIHTSPWDEDVADQFAEVRADLERAGTPIGIMDTMIAAHAKTINAILVAGNEKHFRRDCTGFCVSVLLGRIGERDGKGQGRSGWQRAGG